MTRVYFIRHGESDINLNYRHLIGGQSNYTPLTEYGKNQAELLGKYLLKEKLQFDKVYSSTAIRAIDTAKISLAKIGYTLEDIVLSDKLLELDQGDWTGKHREEIYNNETMKLIDSDPWNFSAPNGESQKQVEERMLKYIYEDILSKNYDNVVIFGHGVAFKCALRGILNSDPKYTYKLVLENTSISEFNYDGKQLNLVKWNDAYHLKYEF